MRWNFLPLQSWMERCCLQPSYELLNFLFVTCTDEHDAYFWAVTVAEITLVLPVGIFSVVSGYRITPVLMFASGFTYFVFVAYQALWTLTVDVEIWLAMVLSVGAGLVGGILFASIRKYGTTQNPSRYFLTWVPALVLYAFIVGCLFGTTIPATPMYPYLKYFWVPLIFIFVFGAAAVVPVWKWEKLGIMIAYGVL